MTSPVPESERFESTLAASGNNTGIVVPESVIERLGAGKRPAVLVNVNGYEYRSTVAVMGGEYMIGFSAAHRAATGLQGGDPIRVTLTIAAGPRAVDMPADFSAALDADESARRFFDGLPNSLQRYHVDNIKAAKTPETRQRRIDKAVTLFPGWAKAIGAPPQASAAATGSAADSERCALDMPMSGSHQRLTRGPQPASRQRGENQ